MNMTDEQLHVISNALRVAAERFDENAQCEGLIKELQDQFKHQAANCRKLYNQIANETGYAS